MPDIEFSGTSLDFFKAMDRVRRLWFSFVPCEELSKSLFGVLMSVRHACMQTPDQPGAKLTDLAPIMRQSLPGVSQKVSALERDGMLVRIADPDDRRISYIALSEKGERLAKLARIRFDERIQATLERLGPQKTIQLLELLDDLADALQASAQSEHSEEEE